MKKLVREHISFSSMKTFQECPYGYKLKYIDKVIKFDASIHTAFGSAVHKANETKIVEPLIDEKKCFVESFRKELKKIPQEIRKEKYSKEMMNEFKEQGLTLVSLFLPELDKLFKDGYELVGVEEKLNESIPGFDNLDFLGYVDLIIKDKKTNKYWILDYKTCSFGWDSRKKTEKLTVYQLSLYKYFWSKKHNIPFDQIETAFLLFKRTAKKDKIEMVDVTNGEKRITNAVEMLQNTIRLIDKKVYIKNRLSCSECWFKRECAESKRIV